MSWRTRRNVSHVLKLVLLHFHFQMISGSVTKGLEAMEVTEPRGYPMKEKAWQDGWLRKRATKGRDEAIPTWIESIPFPLKLPLSSTPPTTGMSTKIPLLKSSNVVDSLHWTTEWERPNMLEAIWPVFQHMRTDEDVFAPYELYLLF